MTRLLRQAYRQDGGAEDTPLDAAVCLGVQWWNQPSIRAALRGLGSEPIFVPDESAALEQARALGATLYSWASRTTADFEAACHTAGLVLVRVEDGFLRSVGLGAGLARGASFAFDSRGIHYDASRPSDLEVMLEQLDLTDEQVAQGARLREAIVDARLTKYNVGQTVSERVFPAGRTGILVPGQIRDDAAIRHTRSDTVDCSGAVDVNLSLLKAVRARNPDAFIVYKPHPDVETCLRKGSVSDDIALRHADRVVSNATIVDLIEQCDRLETVSSLSGFEALLRGCPVTVHGTPFYAGWGLTEDLTALAGRTRRRTIDELTYITIVAYCRYVEPVGLTPCTPEALIEALVKLRADKRYQFRMRFWHEFSRVTRRLGL